MLHLNIFKSLISAMLFAPLIALVFFFNCTAMASDDGREWVTAEGVAPIISGDVDFAKGLAIQLAHQDAVRKSICQDISIESLTVSLRLLGSLAGSIPHCRIAESKILEDGTDVVAPRSKMEPALPIYRYKIIATVVEAETKSDPEFQLEAQLNHFRFHEGEEMVVRITPTVPSYCYIFVILEGGQVIQLMPNRYGMQKRINAGETLIFPDGDEGKRGIMLKTKLPAGKNETTETVFVVALKSSAKRMLKTTEDMIFHRYGSGARYFEQLAAKIAAIPANQRCEKILPYQIVKREH